MQTGITYRKFMVVLEIDLVNVTNLNFQLPTSILRILPFPQIRAVQKPAGHNTKKKPLKPQMKK